MTTIPAQLAEASSPDGFIHHGTPAFRRINLALFAAGLATFGLLYCVQPLLPEFTRDYGVNEAVSALSLSLTMGVLAFGFFGGHSVVSSWVGRRAGAAKAHASSIYLFSYYMGSSIAGACGGLFYAAHGWNGVVGFVGAMALLGLLIALGLYRLRPLPQDTATPPTPMSKGAMP